MIRWGDGDDFGDGVGGSSSVSEDRRGAGSDFGDLAGGGLASIKKWIPETPMITQVYRWYI
jgi:hypothetical protein